MVITIPQDFSKNASSMTDKNPQKMQLQYATNPGYNYISSKLSESAIKEIKANIISEVTTTYTKAVFASITEMGNGLIQASDGTEKLLDGMNSLNDGAGLISDNLNVMTESGRTLQNGSQKLLNGVAGYVDGVGQLDNGINALSDGFIKVSDGTGQLQAGSQQLVDKGTELKDGMVQVTDGTSKIADGAAALANGSKDLQSGITAVTDGISVLNTSLNDGADKISQYTVNDSNVDMFVNPLTVEETQITTVENNGHAMAAYMMSVGLWVGCLAFCLMYPLVKYHDKLKNGLTWLMSKAIILYPTAIKMALVLYFSLHFIDGFNPVQTGNTILVTIVTAVCFMTIMYFFNALLGK